MSHFGSEGIFLRRHLAATSVGMDSLFCEEIESLATKKAEVRKNKNVSAEIHNTIEAEILREVFDAHVEDRDTLKLFNIPPDTTLRRKSASIVSPLRYPGSKRRFASYVAEALRMNHYRPKLFVEPFAGGASVALQMLGDNLVDTIGLGERDPLVADFWFCVFFDSEWLIQSIWDLDVTLEAWQHYKSLTPTTRRERALSCLFLNRTNFSGILNNEVGPIGGMTQSSVYDIACRFPKPTLVKRIQKAATFRDRVQFVWNEGWKETFTFALGIGYKPKDLFFYLDPPFYHKASKLYRHYFLDKDHVELRNALRGTKHRWLLSYDAAEEIKQLYSDKRSFRAQRGVELLYTVARSNKQFPAKEIVVTNLTSLPMYDRVWRIAAQW